MNLGFVGRKKEKNNFKKSQKIIFKNIKNKFSNLIDIDVIQLFLNFSTLCFLLTYFKPF